MSGTNVSVPQCNIQYIFVTPAEGLSLLWLGISLVLVCSMCMSLLLLFITFVSLFIVFIIRLLMYYGRFLSEIKPD